MSHINESQEQDRDLHLSLKHKRNPFSSQLPASQVPREYCLRGEGFDLSCRGERFHSGYGSGAGRKEYNWISSSVIGVSASRIIIINFHVVQESRRDQWNLLHEVPYQRIVPL